MSYLKDWWNQAHHHPHADFDNQVMNITCTLQYMRDFLDIAWAADSIQWIQETILKGIDPHTGLFHTQIHEKPINPLQKISRDIQYTCHLWASFAYDNIDHPYPNQLITTILNSQNILGGFGVLHNSSACEDMDSIDLLLRMGKLSSQYEEAIKNAVQRALLWILANRNEDGGFVFRRNDFFYYGHPLTCAKENESSAMATWFRLLSLHYAMLAMQKPSPFTINRCPGYTF